VSLDLESTLSLKADAEAVAEFLREHGGRLEVDNKCECLYWLVLVPAHKEESYVARVLWSCYPGEPPSVKFATGVGGSLEDPGAWPRVPGFRPETLDICMPFTSEGFALHPEWSGTGDVWRGDGNPFLYVVATLQRLLNTRCEGRFG
jgi:hypothetical protein